MCERCEGMKNGGRGIIHNRVREGEREVRRKSEDYAGTR